MSRQPSIFISHKHADQKIATELRKFLDRWSRKEIPVFQSSDALAHGPSLGRVLTTELKNALWNAGVVFLIYTTGDQDWSYCMWECGVATKPETPETRIVVLQCGAETPHVFEGQVRVNVRNKEDVLKLVKDYLTTPEFFPGAGAAVAPRLSPDGPEVQAAADELYKGLLDVIPKGEVAEWSTQPLLRLELKTEKLAQVTQPAASQTDFATSAVVREMDPQAGHIFGIAKMDAGLHLEALVKHWAERKGHASPPWAEDVRSQVVCAANHEIPAPRWTQLEAADGPECYTPVLTRVRELPSLEALHFDVSLIPFEAASVLMGINDPYLQEYRNAMNKVEGVAQSLTPYFTPIAARWFNDWSEYVTKILSDSGAWMSGPERLEITRLLTYATKKHALIETMVGSPEARHSRDWLSFYDELRERSDIEKTWVLCVEDQEVRKNRDDVNASWKFFNDRKFKTLYCSPREIRRSIGAVLPGKVLEDFGEYVKILPEGSFTAGEKANCLITRFRIKTPEDKRLVASILKCSTSMTEEWLQNLGTGFTAVAAAH